MTVTASRFFMLFGISLFNICSISAADCGGVRPVGGFRMDLALFFPNQNTQKRRSSIVRVEALKLSFNGGPDFRVIVALQLAQDLAPRHGH